MVTALIPRDAVADEVVPSITSGAVHPTTHNLTFVQHPAAVHILQVLSNQRRFEAGSDRPAYLHICAASDMGKSRLLEHYMSKISPTLPGSDLKRRQIVMVEAPHDGQCRKLAKELINACLPDYPIRRSSELSTTAEAILASSGVRQVLIDEAGNLLNTGKVTQQQTLAFLKGICNRGITVCVATTSRMANVLAADEQLQSRFMRIEIPVWQESRELRIFLAGIERALDLRRPAHLDSMTIVRWLLGNNVASTGALIKVLMASARIVRAEARPLVDVDVLSRALSAVASGTGRAYEDR